MMESQRPHRSGSTSSELFICFTSRHSSSSASSMKISSKSILSPARTDKLREPTLSISSSLSRRLRSNGSIKGGQASPMFPTGNKKRGSTFETPEPSSPKVTCIGQVRVKTKKQGKKMRTRSKRRGEMSFRKTEQSEGIQQQHHQECLPHRNQRWVHIPLTICEALRAFGSEFNCFLPCRSSCFSANEREKGEKTKTNTSSSSSCGDTFARWLMAIQEGEEEKRTEITLVVEQEKMGEKTEAVDVMKTSEKGEVEEEIEGEVNERVSICIPPKNALLLMRCRSEPFRMSSFANTFWDSPAVKENRANEDDDEDSEEEEDDDDDDDDDDERQVSESEEEKDCDNANDDDEEESVEEVKGKLYEKQGEEEMAAAALGEPPNLQENEKDSELRGNPTAASVEVEKGEENIETVVEGDSEEQDNQPEERDVEHTEEQILEIEPSVEALEELEEEANDEEKETSLLESIEEAEVVGEEEARRTSSSSSSSSSSVVVSIQPALAEGGGEEAEAQQELVVERESMGLTETSDAVASKETVEESKKETADRGPEVEIETEEEIQGICGQAQQEQQQNQTNEEDQNVEGPGEGEEKGGEATEEVMSVPPQQLNQIHKEDQNEAEDKLEEREKKSKLPDCLLLMMCEPKLSMEVSKETWVCSTDFIRCRPGKQPVIPKDGGEESKKRVSTDSNPAQQQQSQQQEARKSFSNSKPPPAPAPAVVAPPSMASMIEQKLVNAKAYEPFVLTRCKSEPMRSSAKLAPEACFWKNRRLEPHPPATLGVGGGVGF